MYRIDYVDIRPHALGRGLTRWQGAAADLDAAWRAATAEIRNLEAAAPWGGDAAGTAFRNAYGGNGGPSLAIDRGTALVEQLGVLGSLVRTSAENARGMDAEQAQAMRKLLDRI